MKNNIKKAIALILTIVTVFTVCATTAFATEEDISFRMTNRYMTIYYGYSDELTIYTNSDNVYFTSSNEKVATVDENGVVTSKGIGECVITAGVEGTDLKEECTVKVELLWWKFFDNLIAFIRNLLMDLSIVS